jgi:hypothetical protein
MTETLELPKVDISDVLITPEPIFEGSYPEVSQQLFEYSKKVQKQAFINALFKMGKLNFNRGKRPHRKDGTKYSGVPRVERTEKTRSTAKMKKISRRKNRGK